MWQDVYKRQGYENGYNKNTVNKIENKIKTEQLRINQNEQYINNNNNNNKWATFTYICLLYTSRCV